MSLIEGLSIRIPVTVYTHAEQLARDAEQIRRNLIDREIMIESIQNKTNTLIKEYIIFRDNLEVLK